MATNDVKSFLESLESSFEIETEEIKSIISEFHEDMNRGLNGDESSLKMLPAFVDKATGDEEGKFIALDLGGTNFRVLQVVLNGDGSARVQKVGKYVIPNAVMKGTGAQLFNFIAQSIHKFLINNDIGLEKERKMGFTFSFPIKQKDIANGILVNWTKGFTASGVVGTNVVKKLADSMQRYGMENIDVTALANDTVGTLAAGSYKNVNCDVGVIFGTGTNACYREVLEKITKLESKKYKAKRMIINIEWGNFDKLPLNDYDHRLDKASNNPGKQKMEKMISGMYLGELARLVLQDMIKEKYIFSGSKAKFSKGNFKTSHMSLIEGDNSEGLLRIEGYLSGLGILDTTADERGLIKEVCKIVSSRAAKISAASISAVLTHMDPNLDKKHVVAVDGTLFERYPGFRRRIVNILGHIHEDRAANIKLIHTKDGSGLGVAIVAAVTTS